MAKVRYVGPPGQSSTEIAEETEGPAELVPGKTYELSGELAKKLLDSDAKFQRPKKATAEKKKSKKSPSTRSAAAPSPASAAAAGSSPESEEH